jgi:hypothetical protein
MLRLAVVCVAGELTGTLCQSIQVPADILFVRLVADPVVFVDVPSMLKVAPLKLEHPVPGAVQPPRRLKV